MPARSGSAGTRTPAATSGWQVRLREMNGGIPRAGSTRAYVPGGPPRCPLNPPRCGVTCLSYADHRIPARPCGRPVSMRGRVVAHRVNGVRAVILDLLVRAYAPLSGKIPCDDDNVSRGPGALLGSGRRRFGTRPLTITTAGNGRAPCAPVAPARSRYWRITPCSGVHLVHTSCHGLFARAHVRITRSTVVANDGVTARLAQFRKLPVPQADTKQTSLTMPGLCRHPALAPVRCLRTLWRS